MAKKNGRPDKYSTELVKKITESLELGVPLKYACRVAGIHPDTFANWQVKHPELAEIAEQAKARFVQAHLHNIRNIAKDGNWQASMTLLERCVPDEFARPEAKIQIAQFNGVSTPDDPTTRWLSAVDSGAVNSSEPLPQLPEDVTLELPPPAEMADAVPVSRSEVRTVEPEPVPQDPPANSPDRRQLKDSELTPVERIQRYGSANPGLPGSPRGLTVAARPTPTDPSYGGWDGSMEYM